MHNKTAIFGSISFIEHQLADELTIDELAKQSFFSKTHYKRLFHATMGESVMEYIKKRRLHRAGMALCETNASVLDIALQFGYASHEGFSRAFKAHFGLPPYEYRKRYSTQIYPKEANMMTSEARKKITHHTNETAKKVESFAVNLEKWTTQATQEIEKTGRTAGGIRVAFDEWINLTTRIRAAKQEIEKIPAEAETVYDLYDKAHHTMLVFDDIYFQLNLLRFLTGIEWTRMGEHGKPFQPIIEGLTTLCETEIQHMDTTVKLITEIKEQVQKEINQEAQNCLAKTEEILREAVTTGTNLSEKLHALVIKLGAQGRGFALVAKQTEKAVATLRSIDPHAPDIKANQDSAFEMNLNAFNAAVEAARAGDTPEATDCKNDAYHFAGQMHSVVMQCMTLHDEYKRLLALSQDKNNYHSIDPKTKKLGDITFQVPLLNTQIALEAERTTNSKFITLAREFEKTLTLPNNVDELEGFINALSTLVERGKAETNAAGPHGAGIAYILDEYTRLTTQA